MTHNVHTYQMLIEQQHDIVERNEFDGDYYVIGVGQEGKNCFVIWLLVLGKICVKYQCFFTNSFLFTSFLFYQIFFLYQIVFLNIFFPNKCFAGCHLLDIFDIILTSYVDVHRISANSH